jgi:hypothetical protein
MGALDEDTSVNTDRDSDARDRRTDALPQPVPRYDAKGRARPITPEEQEKKGKAVAAFVEKLLAMPDDDPPGAWEEAMRDLDAQRPHRKLFEGF